MNTTQLREIDIDRGWFIIDARNLVLGRLASELARRLQGKHKPEFSYHIDAGDYIVVTNADKISVTGNKLSDKRYYRHTGYPGGIKDTVLSDMISNKPEEVIYKAVKNMLPRNKLGRKMIKKLKVYASESHPHTAQRPADLTQLLDSNILSRHVS